MKLTFSTASRTAPLILNARQDAPVERTLLLMGIDRGGTSAAAAVIDAAGVPIGTSNDGHFETNEFKTKDFKRNLDDPSRWKAMLAQIAAFNTQHAKWGAQIWNNPAMTGRIAAEVRNPHLLIVLRDVVAITERRLSLPDETATALELLDRMLAETHRLLVHLTTLPLPTMLVSFERLRIQPAEVVPHIADFMGIKLTESLLQEAVARVNLKGGYLIQTR